MKEKSHKNVFFRRFIRSLLFVIFLFLVGLLSYSITRFYYKITDAEKNTKSDSIIKEIISNTEVEDVSKNLIYSIDEETGKISRLVLEIFNTNTGNLDYITIPIKTEFTISNELYQKLYANNHDIPQIVMVKHLHKYFDSDTLCAYGVLLVEDFLDIDISYYTALPSSKYKKMFTTIMNEQQSLKVQAFSEGLKEELESIDTKDKLKEYITSIYGQVHSNLTLNNKLKYLDAYYDLDPNHIYYYSLYGEMLEANFTVDVMKSNALIQDILGNDTYEVSQTNRTDGNTGEYKSSKGLNIQILNASKIPGLAAKFQEKLTLSGFQVMGIGNYEDEILTNTQIIVKDETIGSDLIENFNNPDVIVGELPEGVDIQIVLGTNDNILQ